MSSKCGENTREVSLLTNISKYETEIENIYDEDVIDDNQRKENILASDKLKSLRNGHAKHVKKFWYTVFTQHPAIPFNYTKLDKSLLLHLNNVCTEYIDSELVQYRIIFQFNKNDIIKNTSLFKEFSKREDSPKFDKIIWRNEAGRSPINNKGSSFLSWYHIDNGLADPVGELILSDITVRPLQYYSLGQISEDSDSDQEDGSDSSETFSIKNEEIAT